MAQIVGIAEELVATYLRMAPRLFARDPYCMLAQHSAVRTRDEFKNKQEHLREAGDHVPDHKTQL